MKKDEMKLKKGYVIQLNEVLATLKVNKVSKECVYSLLDIKINLSEPVQKIQEAQKLAATDLKPKELDNDLQEEEKQKLQAVWNEKYINYMSIYLEEEISLKLVKLSREDVFELIRENNLDLTKAEILSRLVDEERGKE